MGFSIPCAPKTISLANNLPRCPTLDLRLFALLLLSQCPLDAPTHPAGGAPSPKPDPFAPQHPEKTVTFLRRPCSSPATQTSYRRPTTGPRLRSLSPPIRPNPTISPPPLAIYAHTCYHRPREGQTPRPGIPTPIRDYAPGIRRGVDDRPLAPTRSLSSSATRRDTCVQKCHAGHYRLAQDRRRSQLRTQQNVAEMSRFHLPTFAGTTLLGVSGNRRHAPCGKAVPIPAPGTHCRLPPNRAASPAVNEETAIPGRRAFPARRVDWNHSRQTGAYRPCGRIERILNGPFGWSRERRTR